MSENSNFGDEPQKPSPKTAALASAGSLLVKAGNGMRAKIKKPAKVTGQPEILAAVVKSKGSGAVVAKELGCSQQSVSEWMRGSWAPRLAVQKKMEKLYGIPAPWAKGT